MLRSGSRLIYTTAIILEKSSVNKTQHITRQFVPIQHVALPLCRSMGFWGDFYDKFKSEYANNDELKKSVNEVSQAAGKVADASSKITNAAKSGVGAVSEKISKTLPQSDPDKPGKVSEGVKKALDVLGNTLSFMGDAKNPYTKQKGEDAPKVKKTDKKPSSTNETTTDETSKDAEPKIAKATPKKEEVKEVQSLSEEDKKIAPGGGEALVIRPVSEWERYWERFGGDATAFGFKQVGNTVGSFVNRILPESHIAATFAKIKETMNPDFTLHSFMRDMDSFAPEIIQAIISEDLPGLKLLSSDKFYRTQASAAASEAQRGVYQDSQLLDVGHIDLWDAKIDDADGKPIIAIMCHNIQLIFRVRNRKGELVFGAEDDIKTATVSMVLKPDLSETQWVCHEMIMMQLQSFV
eukprot:TRINITY_DN3535_c0_g1_i1.p1 TRINITY_DN3535_c0_g1~~TRINITY_DN3535_c0_g1_i1.p1  ORF type:complete len:409 (+),score=116.14 TRINITY_DN3535_c0_g1_i1:203-1429(+)